MADFTQNIYVKLYLFLCNLNMFGQNIDNAFLSFGVENCLYVRLIFIEIFADNKLRELVDPDARMHPVHTT